MKILRTEVSAEIVARFPLPADQPTTCVFLFQKQYSVVPASIHVCMRFVGKGLGQGPSWKQHARRGLPVSDVGGYPVHGEQWPRAHPALVPGMPWESGGVKLKYILSMESEIRTYGFVRVPIIIPVEVWSKMRN